MAKKIQVVVDVESNSVQIASDQALTLTQQIRLLRQELQKTPEGTKEFNLLVTKLNDTQDALGRVTIKGKEVFGTLGLIPGPIGEIAARTNSAIDALKVFGSLKTSDLQSQFKALREDFKEMGSTLFRLTGLQKLYVTSTRAVSQGLQAMGVSIKTASTAAKAFAVTMTALTAATGLILITTLVTQLSEAYEYLSTKAERADEAQKKLNASLLKGAKAALDAESDSVKRTGDLLLAQAKARGANADEIYKIEQSNRKLLLESQQRYYDDLKNKDSDEAIAAVKSIKDTQNNIKIAEADFQAEQLKTKQEAGKKLTDTEQQRLDKEKQLRDQALAAISKGEEDAFKATLTTREKEEYEINQKYAALIADATKYGQDVTLLQIGLQAELEKLRNKNSVEDTEAFEEKLEKDLKAIEDANKTKFNAESIALELKYASGLLKEEEYQLALFELKNKYATSDQERQQAEIDLISFANTKRDESVESTKKANEAIVQSYLSLTDNLATSFTTIANLFEKGSDAAKAFAIIGVLLNAASAIGKTKLAIAEAITEFGKAKAAAIAYASIGTAMLPLNPVQGAALIASSTKAGIAATAGAAAAKAAGTVQIATIGITTAAQIASILATTKDSKSVNASPGGAGGGSQAPTPAFSGTVTVPAPQIGASQASQSGTLGQTIAGAVMEGNSKSRPIQTYVVGDQISTQQQLDRRISVAAKMGG